MKIWEGYSNEMKAQNAKTPKSKKTTELSDEEEVVEMAVTAWSMTPGISLRWGLKLT